MIRKDFHDSVFFSSTNCFELLSVSTELILNAAAGFLDVRMFMNINGHFLKRRSDTLGVSSANKDK